MTHEEPGHEKQLGAAPDDHEQRTSRCRLSAMFPAVELEVITSVLARSGGDVVLGRGMSRAGGDDGEPTATTPDGGALARVLQRSLEAEVATGEQQLQSDEQQRNELQLHIDEQQLQSEDEQQLQSDEQTARALQAVWEAKEDAHPVRFCALAFVGCVIGFTLEMQQNGWAFQPVWCGSCDDGTACNEDGTPCEANLLLGPSYAAMVRSGGKLDRLIFDEGEWWRVLSCNWLHGGLLHFAMNMFALRNLGVPLERCFGSWRVGVLYLLSGIFGTMVSVIFLPEVLSVGASASVFGLIGACWADVALNFCARGTLRGAKGHACSLLLSTLINVCIGLTPFIDNFMHMGGLVAGLVIGGMLFSKKHPDAHGVLRYRESQRKLVFLSAVLFAVLCILTVAFAASPDTQQFFRSCSLCRFVNCVEPTFITGSPWWDCDLAMTSAGYACTLHRALDDVMLCFCTDTPSCDGLNVGSAYDGMCALGDGACSKDGAAWCRDEVCQ